jgi:hypothetical protein
MWSSRCQELSADTLHFVVERGAKPATFADVLRGLQNDASFRAWFNTLLADAPFSAFRWETPGVTSATATRPFEFVLLDDPDLARRPDSDAFAEHFRRAPEATVIDFANLRGDAVLVVPCPRVAHSAYGHLAAFVREAPADQRDALWLRVGELMSRRLGPKPVWLSTAGAGVSWLHVQLDDRPKYYGHERYRKNPD